MVSVSIPIAHDTLLHCVLNVIVHVRPINIDSSMSLGFLNTHVSLVDTFQEVYGLIDREMTMQLFNRMRFSAQCSSF